VIILQIVKKLKVQAFRDAKPCRLASKGFNGNLLGRLELKDEGNTIRRNVCDYLPHSRRLTSSTTPLPELKPLKVKNFPVYQTYGSLSCSKELPIGPYPSARRIQSKSPYRIVVLQAFLTSKMSATFCLNSMYKLDVRLQCIRKIFGYLSNDLFPVSAKYSLNGPGGNVGYIWISIQSGVLISS
jgi:hypothetical protein